MAGPWAGMCLACPLAIAVHRQKRRMKLLIFRWLERTLMENGVLSEPILVGRGWGPQAEIRADKGTACLLRHSVTQTCSSQCGGAGLRIDARVSYLLTRGAAPPWDRPRLRGAQGYNKPKRIRLSEQATRRRRLAGRSIQPHRAGATSWRAFA